MFAPYCPTCAKRVLLGTGRIVSADLSTTPMQMIVRCFCGTAVAANNPVPEPSPDVGETEPRVA